MPIARRLSTLAAAAAILVLGLPLASYYIRRAPTSDAERAAGDVTLVSPRGEVRSAQPVALAWRSVPSAEQYDVSIVADDGSNVVRQSTRDTTLLARTALPAGRDYYWKVIARLANGGERRSESVRFRLTAP